MWVEWGCFLSREEQSKGKGGHCLLERGTSPAQEASLIGAVRRQELRGLNPSVQFYPLTLPFLERG